MCTFMYRQNEDVCIQLGFKHSTIRISLSLCLCSLFFAHVWMFRIIGEHLFIVDSASRKIIIQRKWKCCNGSRIWFPARMFGLLCFDLVHFMFLSIINFFQPAAMHSYYQSFHFAPSNFIISIFLSTFDLFHWSVKICCMLTVSSFIAYTTTQHKLEE